MASNYSAERVEILKNEIKMAEAYNREELEPKMWEALQRYIGKHIPIYGASWDIILNEVYPIIQNNLPSIFFRNPRAFLKPRNKTFIARKRNPVSGAMEEQVLDASASARTQEAILNYCIEEISYKKEVRKVLLDALLFPHGILWHGYKGNFGMTEEASFDIKKDMPFVKRINPMRFLFDPAVTMANVNEGRWQARSMEVPLEDLLEDDKLDVDKKALKGFPGYGDRVGTASATAYRSSGGQDALKLNSMYRNLIDFTDEKYRKGQACRFVKVYEVYVRPTKKELREGKSGYILLLTDEQTKPLRVNDWVIKAEGFPGLPLVFNELCDSKFSLADIDTYKDIADQKNAIINLQLRNAYENSKVWVAIAKEGANEEDVEKVQNGNQTILLFEGDSVNGKMAVASPGGTASNELYLLDGRVDKNLQDKSGVSDLKKGFLQSGEESATSVKLRNAGSSARPAYRQDIMADFLKGSFKYINQINKQFMPFTEAVRIVGSLDIQWSDAPTKEEIQADVDVEIDAISMLPESPEKEIQELNTVLNLMVQGLTNPAIAQKLKEENKTINLSPIIEQLLMRLKIRNPDIFRSIKPEESMGTVSVEQLREAKANVQAALTGQQVPFPPTVEDDHLAKIEIYSTIQQLLQAAGQVSDMLDSLLQVQAQLLQQAQEKQSQPGTQVALKKPSVSVI